jgi:hypothetical protein
MHHVIETVEEDARPSPIEFEMAYQARIAMDRIKFAITHTEKFGPRSDQMREASLQLLDALQRLETVDRRFQARSLAGGERNAAAACAPNAVIAQRGN